MKTLKQLCISPAPWTTESYDTEGASDIVNDRDGEWIVEWVNPPDSRLVAAAPDLYEALREIYETVEGENVHFTGASAWFTKARAALEKAGGAE